MLQSSRWTGRSFPWIVLLLLPLWGTLTPPNAMGQEVGRSFGMSKDRPRDTEQAEWLTWIAKSKSTKNSSWMPSWSIPKTLTPWPASKPSSSYTRNKKTTMQKLSQTSKRWWDKTVDFLDPYPPAKPPSAKSNATRPSWFGGWFGGNEESSFDSVSDWAGQEMPK